MQPDQQQRIMGYFIEEAKDHLNTIEQGLLNLQNTIEDPEMVNEVFRAAHSVKGGAAMLGLSSIQHVSHRLEDFFKLLKETPVRVDQKLETLFLRTFDSLQELLGQLQGPFGLTEESANNILAGVEPTFEELEQHLVQLASATGGISFPTTTGFGLDTGFTLPVDSQVEESLANLFRTDVTLRLREMLQLFRLSEADPATRQQLQAHCETLGSFGDRYGLRNWSHLLETARRAIAHPDNSYRILAPIVIKDIKQAQELVLAGRENEIYPSIQLQDLIPDVSVETVVQDDLADLLALQSLDLAEVGDQPLDLAELNFDPFASVAGEADLEELSSDQELDLIDAFSAEPLPLGEFESQNGPEVGMAELNTLADLFEGEMPDLGLTWHQEEVLGENDELLATGASEAYSSDQNNDFSDLLFEETPSAVSEPGTGAGIDDLDNLFGDVELLVEEDASENVVMAPPSNFDTSFDTTATDLDLNLDEMDDLLQIAESTSESDHHPDPLANLDGVFSEEVNIPDPWDVGSQAEQPDVTGPELGLLSLEDLDLDALEDNSPDDNLLEELSSQDAHSDNLVDAFPLSESELESDPGTVHPSSQAEAIADPWEEPSASVKESRPLSDLFLDELEVTPDEFEATTDPLTSQPVNDPLISQPVNDLFEENLFEAELFEGDLFGETIEPASDADLDDLFGEPVTSSISPVDDLFGEAIPPSTLADNLLEAPTDSSALVDDLFGDIATSSASVDDFGDTATESVPVDNLFEELTDSSTSVDDLFGDTVAASDPVDDLVGDTAAASASADDLFGDTAAASAPTDDLFGDTAPAFVPVDDLFGDTAAASASVDDLFGDTAPAFVPVDDLFEEPADPSAPVDDLFGDTTPASALVDDLFGDIAEPALSDIDELFGGLEPEDRSEFTQSDRNDQEFVPVFESPDDITDFLEEEDSLDVSTTVEDESSELSDQELDELLGGVSTQEMEDFLGESFNLDSELMGGLDLEPDAIAESASTADFMGLGTFAEENLSDSPITTPLENTSADVFDQLDQLEVDEPFAFALEELDTIPDGESPTELSVESQLDFEQSFSALEPAATEFGELDSLLDNSSTTANFFGDLEGLLSENAIPETETHAEARSLIEGLEEDTVHEHESSDDFLELETVVEGGALGIAAAGAMGLAGSLESTPSVSSPEFDDLDDLLKDAEEKMGGSPSVTIGRGAVPQARRIMRPGRVFSEQTMRVPVKHLDNLSNLVGELVVNRNSLEQDQERLRQSLDNLLYQVQQLSDVGQRMQDLYERSLLESSLLASRQSHHRVSAISSAGRGNAVPEMQEPSGAVEYDPLEMDRFTGFHSLSQEMIELIVRVRESSSDIEFIVDETEQVTRMFRQVTTQLQEGLTRSRMVPFAQTADRLPRAVRDISMKVGKQAELVVEGRETLIDKMILEQLYDPMTHLVNNALTHGIEPPEVRRAQGKPPGGRIAIRAFHQGNQTIISVSDDGKGIDVELVKAKAIEKGLITAADAQHLSRLDIYDILFHPGFSTKDQADDFSGRGVGMDVVRTSLSEIRGVVNIDSTPGKGTTFTIRLPLTLSISKALCCISDRARIAFPMDGVEDMLDLPKERLQVNAEGHPCIAWRDTTLPVRPLSDLLTYNRHLSRGNVYGGNQEDDIVSIVVLRSAGNFLALQVDQVLGEQEIVIKQLEGPVPKPPGVAGATVLGDGRIMPIADVLELIDLSMGRLRRDSGGALWDQSGGQEGQEPPVVKTEPMVLIVDDSITVRELLSMTFNKVGYRVEQARDGQEAWEKLRSGMPCDIVFCDIEMPRMDGLELLSRIQKDPHLKQLPIAMLTSRGADRHRQMAATLGASGYFTKPYLEEALLDAAQRMLRGERLLSNEG